MDLRDAPFQRADLGGRVIPLRLAEIVHIVIDAHGIVSHRLQQPQVLLGAEHVLHGEGDTRVGGARRGRLEARHGRGELGLLDLLAALQVAFAEKRHQDRPGADVARGVDALLQPGRRARIARQRIVVQQAHHD